MEGGPRLNTGNRTEGARGGEADFVVHFPLWMSFHYHLTGLK